jgi:alkylhydroperoxidase family enzyme
MADGSSRRMNEAPPEVQKAYEKMQRSVSAGMLKLLTDTPNLLKDFLAHYGIVGQSLPRRLYEMVYIRISAANQCHS